MIFDKIFELTRKGYRVTFLPYECCGFHFIKLHLRKEYANACRIMEKEEFTESRILMHLNKLEDTIEKTLRGEYRNDD